MVRVPKISLMHDSWQLPDSLSPSIFSLNRSSHPFFYTQESFHHQFPLKLALSPLWITSHWYFTNLAIQFRPSLSHTLSPSQEQRTTWLFPWVPDFKDWMGGASWIGYHFRGKSLFIQHVPGSSIHHWQLTFYSHLSILLIVWKEIHQSGV